MIVLEVYREFFGEPQKVGHFERGESDGISFLYSREYLANSDAAPLSFSLPLQEAPFQSSQYQGFFEGLVPEGRILAELAYRFRISPSDYLGVLQHLGEESIGALMFVNPRENRSSLNKAAYEEILPKTMIDLIEFPVRTSAELAEKGRFSLTGAQAKIGIYLNEGTKERGGLSSLWKTCYLPQGRAPSTHICKIPDKDFQSLPINEFFCLSLARACGIPVVEAFVQSIEDSLLFVSKRYDRFIQKNPKLVSKMPCPLRLHQEDMCQALGMPAYGKYEILDTSNYVARIAQLLERASSRVMADKELFAKQILFDYLIGNCDNHIKNFALLYAPDWKSCRLAPAYDIVCTTVLGYSREMGISIGDSRVIDDISPEDWKLFAQDLGVSEALIMGLLEEIVSNFREFSEKVSQDTSCFDESPVIEDILLDAGARLEKMERFLEKDA